ncbi:CAP domain-containing protein [Streptomyces sp. JJ38]|nr:CAP domain-containing protein [Streptomyces sp. JJ38]
MVTATVATLVAGGAIIGLVTLWPEGSTPVTRSGIPTEAGLPDTGPLPSSPEASPSRAPSPSTSPSPTTSPSPSPTPTPEKPSPSPSRPTPPPAPEPPAPPSTGEEVESLVNAERAKAGCGPVRTNSRLAEAALAHSRDMAARSFFDHTNPDGEDPGDRITAAGYQWSRYGENIARGQRTASEVVEGWMNSPGHRANILNCSFEEMGIGRHTGSGGPWWTQVFGTSR